MKHILITVYTVRHGTAVYAQPNIDNYSGYLCAAVEAIRSQVDNSSSPPLSIFDDMGNLILQTGNFPAYCVAHCDPKQNTERCMCFQRRKEAPEAEKGQARDFVCPRGLTVFQVPIQYNGRFMGNVFSGHIFLGTKTEQTGIDMYDTPAGTMLAVQRWTENIVESIVRFCSFNAIRNSLNVKDTLIKQIERERQDQEALRDSLNTMQNTVTNLRINRHFLFNTLNAIAGQALQGDEDATYQAITDLAKMFRYSTSVDLKIVSLSEEIEYLKTYLHMQQLRYGDGLSAQLTCPDGVLNCLVPFNFLQTFVENAFTHGFRDIAGQKVLNLQISRRNDTLEIVIMNNGELIDAITINRILSGMGSDSGHGLSLTYAKLQNTYGENFTINMTSDTLEGTKITITLPYVINQQQVNGGDV